MSDLSIQIESKPTAMIVRLGGNAGAGNAPSLDRQIREIIVRNPALVVVDLAGVWFISSTAVGLLAHLQRGVEQAGGRLYLAGPTPRVREVIERCRIGDLLPMVESIESAVK